MTSLQTVAATVADLLMAGQPRTRLDVALVGPADVLGPGAAWAEQEHRLLGRRLKTFKVAGLAQFVDTLANLQEVPRIEIWTHGSPHGDITIGDQVIGLGSTELRDAIGTRALSLGSVEFQGCDVGVNPPVLAAFGRMVGAREIVAWTQTHVLHPMQMEFRLAKLQADAKVTTKRLKAVEAFLPAGVPTEEAAVAAHLRSVRRSPFVVSLEYWSRDGARIRRFDEIAKAQIKDLQDAVGFGISATGRRDAKLLAMRAAEATKPLVDLSAPTTTVELQKVVITFP